MKNIRPIYSWTESASYSVPAEVAGGIVEKLRADVGEDNLPHRLVDEARAEAHPLHRLFQWDDDRAAHAYRVSQARRVISSLRVQFKPNDKPLPAFYNIVTDDNGQAPAKHVYVQSQKALANGATRQAIVEAELKRLMQSLARVQGFPEFEPIMRAARDVEAALRPIAAAAD